MNNPQISVVIPVYNVEKYLCRCVDSVLNQTYKNIEVILVDDGSPDGCPVICDEYAQKDNRVKVIHKPNGGLSSARNAALDSPLVGDYLAFVDSDDWLELDTLEYCLDLVKNYHADVVQFEFYETDSEKNSAINKKERVETFEGKEILQQLMITGSWGVWGALYKAEVLGNVRFREGKINEDIDYKYKILNNAQRMVYSNQKKYYYYQSGDTISMGGLKRKDFDLYDAAEELYKLTQNEDFGTIRFLGEVKRRRSAFSLLCKIAYFGVADPTLSKKEIVRKLTKEHRNNVAILLKGNLSLNRKVLAVLFAINYHFSELIVRLLKRFLVY